MTHQPKKIRLALMGLGLLWINHAFAFDLLQTYQQAHANDPTYLSAMAQKNIADAQKTQARSLILPTISLGASAYQTRDQLFFGKRSTKKYPTNLGISFNQPLLDLGSLTAFKQVNINSSATQLNIEQAEQDLITRVIQTYFTALLSQGNASIAQVQETATARQLAVAMKNFEVGNSTIIDKLEAEAAYHNAHAALITATSTKDNAFAALEDMVGHSITEPLAPVITPLHLKMPVPDTQEKWVERARQENLAVRLAKLSDKNAQLETRRRNQQRLPIVNLVASQSWAHDNANHTGDKYKKSSSIGLELSMPIFNGGLISAQVDEAQALQVQSMQNIRATEMTVAQATRTAYNQAVGGLASITALEAASKASSSSVKANSVGYNLGMRINIDVLNAQTTDAQTKYNLAQAQYNALMGNVNLKSAIAGLSEADIHYINNLLGKAETLPAQIQKTTETTTSEFNKLLDPLPANSTVTRP